MWSTIALDSDPAFPLVFAGLGAVGVPSARERVHRVLAPVAPLGFTACMAVLFGDQV